MPRAVFRGRCSLCFTGIRLTGIRLLRFRRVGVRIFRGLRILRRFRRRILRSGRFRLGFLWFRFFRFRFLRLGFFRLRCGGLGRLCRTAGGIVQIAAAAVNYPEIVHLLGLALRNPRKLLAEALEAHTVFLGGMEAVHLLFCSVGGFPFLLLANSGGRTFVNAQQILDSLDFRLAFALKGQHSREKSVGIIGGVNAVYILHLFHQRAAVCGNTAAADMRTAQSPFQAEKTILQVCGETYDVLYIVGPLLQAAQGVFQFGKLRLKGQRRVGQLVQDGRGVRHRLA